MMNFRYCIVEMLETPHHTVPSFVCIPNQWVNTKPIDNKTVVRFPKEQFIATKGRILTGESARDNWRTYSVNLKLGCDDLNEGMKLAADLAYKDKTNQNAQFSSPAKPAKRAEKRARSNEEYNSLSKGNKRSYAQQPDEKRTMPTTNQRYEKEQQTKIKEKQLLTKLSDAFRGMRKTLDKVSYTLGDMSEIVDNIKTTFSKTADETDEFLNANKQHDEMYDFPEDSDTSSKWTLRHKCPKDGLEELFPRSKVYVRTDVLEEINTEAESPNVAARMLMMEIFSDYALANCSLSGGKRECMDRSNKTCGRVPPGLDKYSRLILMKYLHKLAIERDWEINENQIWNSLRNKLLKVRTSALFTD